MEFSLSELNDLIYCVCYASSNKAELLNTSDANKLWARLSEEINMRCKQQEEAAIPAMTEKEALKTVYQIIELRNELEDLQRYNARHKANPADAEEIAILRKEIAGKSKSLRYYITGRRFGHTDWDDSVETMMACGLSENQANFIKFAEYSGQTITAYSGRAMYGECCPAVVDDYFDFKGDMLTDNMGLQTVFYARS